MREKLPLLSCYGPLFHRTSTLPIPFSGLQNYLRSCSEVNSAGWLFSAEKSHRFSKVFEVVKETGWKRVVVKRRTELRSGNTERVGWLGPLLASRQYAGWYNAVRRHGFLPYVPTCILKGDEARFSSFHDFRSMVDMVYIDGVFTHRMASIKGSDEAANLRMADSVVSICAPPSEVAINGAALKVTFQEITGVGLWCRGFLVHLMASCFAGSVFEVQSVTLDLIRFFGDIVNEWYWFCQPYLISPKTFIFKSLGPTWPLVMLCTLAIMGELDIVYWLKKGWGTLAFRSGVILWPLQWLQVQPENLNIIDKHIDKGDIQRALNTSTPSGVTLSGDDKKADDRVMDHPQTT
ncbi:hypothetical protein V6N13_013270 [Hibiscus sabdariffa]|uniref:Uncharacterized protein n=1 Tax=Hibiscus sabdariffa TaxID=183260 RepID=A0ABR2SHK0_9ROSI